MSKNSEKYACKVRSLRWAGVFGAVLLGVAMGRPSICEAQAPSLQQVSSYISSAPMPIGSGARALAYNGAFTAIADDATAASWNPAGLVQLQEIEVSTAGSYFHRQEEYGTTRPQYQLSQADGNFGGVDLNYLSAVYPFTLFKRNIVVSLNYQRLYEFRREVSSHLQVPDQGDTELDFSQEGALATVSPAVAVQITPWLSAGVTLNIWMDELGSSEAFHGEMTLQEGSKLPQSFRERFRGASGVNATLGVLAHPVPGLTLAGSLDLPFRAKLDVVRWFERASEDPPELTLEENWERISIDFPLSASLGFAWRFSDSLTAALDYTFTDWSQFKTRSTLSDVPGWVNAITREKRSADATHTVRLGVEYLWILQSTTLPVRAGVGYDPQPAGDGSEDYWTAAFGTGVSYELETLRFILDLAYQVRFGLGVQKQTLAAVPGSDADVLQHTLMTSLIVHIL